ncbi:hypothetical protein GGQ84_001511 [Desulfitispora alkaliphila]|uniref:hypothetical protein n=1 Tax=Desulfitispora alkaliphila TaxID=622674 RepID=UPI003D1AEFFB
MKKSIILIAAIIVLMVAVTATTAEEPWRQGYIEGYLVGVEEAYDGHLMHVESYAGRVHTISLGPDASVTIDNRPVRFEDLKPGMEVYGEVESFQAISLEGYSTGNLGYIPPGSKVRSGVVRAIDRDQLEIQLPTGVTKTYYTSPITIALRQGQRTSLDSLYVGDRVKLYFDEYDSKIVSRMNIEGESILVQDIYRGTLNVANGFSQGMVLEDVEVLRDGKWTYKQGTVSLPYSVDNPVYLGGQQVDFRNLRYYRGSTAYMAVNNFFGRERIEKMVLQGQYESTYSSKIEEINWYAEEFELANNMNFNFHDGTIIVKSGRLVDKYSLNPKSDAFIVSDGRGSQRSAALIQIYNEDINNSNIGNHYVYAGKLDMIVEDTVRMKDFYILNQNSWESFSETKELFFDNDTVIYDLENDRELTHEEFISGDYAVDKDSRYARDRNLRGWYAYAYTEGDRIATIQVQKSMDSLLRQRITNGTITSVVEDELVGWRIELRDARDWSERLEQWMAKSVPIKVNVDSTMIIKDGTRISPQELSDRDRIYLVRDDFIGKVLIVK